MVAQKNTSSNAARTQPAAGLTLSHNSEPITILLVDDDADCRLLIRDAISDCKVSNKVYEAQSGAQALDFLYQRGACRGMSAWSSSLS